MELLVRFLVGGAVVTVFAMAGDVFKPKSFAGLFGAAPSVALASLGLSISRQGTGYASTEAFFMMFGAAALFIYTSWTSHLLRVHRWKALTASLVALPSWFAVAFGLWFLFRGALI